MASICHRSLAISPLEPLISVRSARVDCRQTALPCRVPDRVEVVSARSVMLSLVSAVVLDANTASVSVFGSNHEPRPGSSVWARAVSHDRDCRSALDGRLGDPCDRTSSESGHSERQQLAIEKSAFQHVATYDRRHRRRVHRWHRRKEKLKEMS